MDNLNPMYITFALYIVALLGIGAVAYMATRNFGDYILGGRRLGGFVTGLAAGASDMSGWLLMGLPGAVYASGLIEAWIAIGLTIGAYLNWLFVAGRLRIHTEFCNNSLTLPEYFASRFGEYGTLLKIASAAIILLFFTLYSASGVVAGARLFQQLFDVDYSTAIWLGAGATIIYTFVGGFLAVSWSDSLQASLMFFALIFTPIAVYLSLGGAEEMSAAFSAAVATSGKTYSALVPEGTSALAIFSTAAWGFGYFGQPHILARFMAAENAKTIVSARRISMVWMILCLVGAVYAGYFGIAYFQENPDQIGVLRGDSERVFMGLAMTLFNPWIAGIILSAILAAVMSTLSAQLLVCSSALTEDFYKGFIRPTASQAELVWLGRIMVLAIAVIAIVLAQDPDSKVLGLVSYAWAGFGAAFGPVVIFSVFWKRTTALGALAGMVIGAVVVVCWKYTGSSLYEIVPGFFACSIVLVLVSLVTKVPETVEKRFEEADAEYKRQMTA
ncbi:sodium/proline symporter PutP [Pelistega europaea]|uniref:Sodium/proline symporter n=1 Tax=Pelistega europaea TaxID=106147 RepID=A0A7Y4LDN7_9BURK|nr:sodium/proline symporter PutP [Pelistega europaea]NOL50321.1 sodium/proline symporter PutP [Pelistega europaea]